jgi:hypothetical protein
MFNRIKQLYLNKIYEWTEEVNHNRMMNLLNEILNGEP